MGRRAATDSARSCRQPDSIGSEDGRGRRRGARHSGGRRERRGDPCRGGPGRRPIRRPRRGISRGRNDRRRAPGPEEQGVRRARAGAEGPGHGGARRGPRSHASRVRRALLLDQLVRGHRRPGRLCRRERLPRRVREAPLASHRHSRGGHRLERLARRRHGGRVGWRGEGGGVGGRRSGRARLPVLRPPVANVRWPCVRRAARRGATLVAGRAPGPGWRRPHPGHRPPGAGQGGVRARGRARADRVVRRRVRVSVRGVHWRGARARAPADRRLERRHGVRRHGPGCRGAELGRARAGNRATAEDPGRASGPRCGPGSMHPTSRPGAQRECLRPPRLRPAVEQRDRDLVRRRRGARRPGAPRPVRTRSPGPRAAPGAVRHGHGRRPAAGSRNRPRFRLPGTGLVRPGRPSSPAHRPGPRASSRSSPEARETVPSSTSASSTRRVACSSRPRTSR